MKIRVNLGSRSFEVGYKIWSKEAYDELRKTNSDEDILDSMIDDEDIIVNEYDLSGGGINVEDENYNIIWEEGKDEGKPLFDVSTIREIEQCKEDRGIWIYYVHEYKPGIYLIFDIEGDFDISKLKVEAISLPGETNLLYKNAVYDGKSAEYFDGWVSGKGMSAYKQDFSSGKLVETCLA